MRTIDTGYEVSPGDKARFQIRCTDWLNGAALAIPEAVAQDVAKLTVEQPTISTDLLVITGRYGLVYDVPAGEAVIVPFTVDDEAADGKTGVDVTFATDDGDRQRTIRYLFDVKA